MASELFQFFLDIPKQLAPFTNWLFTELPYVHIKPIALFTLTGFIVILGFHLAHLVNVVFG